MSESHIASSYATLVRLLDLSIPHKEMLGSGD